MSAYPSPQRESLAGPNNASLFRLPSALATTDPMDPTLGNGPSGMGSAFFSQLVDQLAEQVAAVVLKRLASSQQRDDEWLDSRHAAEYLGVHRDTLRKLAAERAIPAEQDGAGCKLYFRRSDLDAWRRGGGRPRHLASNLAVAA
jgi:excisionase family DNA binding protein